MKERVGARRRFWSFYSTGRYGYGIFAWEGFEGRNRGYKRPCIYMEEEQGGWQKVSDRSDRRCGLWKGKKIVDIASRSNRVGDRDKNFTTFFFSDFPIIYWARDMLDVFSNHGKVKEVVILTRRDSSGRRFSALYVSLM